MVGNIRVIAIAIIVAGALIAGALYFGLSGQATGTIHADTTSLIGDTSNGMKLNQVTVSLAELEDDDPSIGSGSVVVIEFSDYACGYCARHHAQTIPLIKENYIDTGKIKYIHRNYVIYALEEAEAAECAHDQGKYWEFHDLLFWNQGSIEEGSLEQFASDLNMDVDQFKTCLESEEKIPELENDFNMGRALGISGTPTTLVVGQRENVDEQGLSVLLKLDLELGEYFEVFEDPNEAIIIAEIVGAQPYETFQKTIDAML